MARMHTRKKGSSRSRKPENAGKPKWIDYKGDEIENLVLKLRGEEHSGAKIGLILRDQYGIPSVKDMTGKTITQILKNNKQAGELPEDLMNLLKRSVNVTDHMDKNKKDVHTKRGLQCIESKIRRLAKYYKGRNMLPSDWKYTKETAKTLVH
ncbi:MAG: 30S ribosomal protein S15 [Candidatus Aenigmarchaeota archaeon]|nr:30S ribosomal protein S15 [Candidatus Aenigmarchaeota archaeon]